MHQKLFFDESLHNVEIAVPDGETKGRSLNREVKKTFGATAARVMPGCSSVRIRLSLGATFSDVKNTSRKKEMGGEQKGDGPVKRKLGRLHQKRHEGETPTIESEAKEVDFDKGDSVAICRGNALKKEGAAREGEGEMGGKQQDAWI